MSRTELLEKARRARPAGDYGAAQTLCRQMLDKSPVDPQAAGLLGQCLAELGDAAAAKGYIELAAGLAPDDADIRLNIAAFKDRSDDLAGTVEEARNVAALDPDKFEILATYGNLLGKTGDFRAAARVLVKACRINPHPGAALLLAGAAMEILDYDAVRRALDMVDAASPDLPQTLKLRTHLARAKDDSAAIIACSERWLRLYPSDPEARVALAFGLAAEGRYLEASSAYEPLIAPDNPSADHIAAMGRYRLGARAVEDALQWFDRAVGADRRHAEAHFERARALTFLGRLEEAQSACQAALDADPAHAEALAQLTEIVGGALCDAHMEALAHVAAAASLAPDRKATALYALGDAFHARKRHEEIFDAWSRANALKNEQTRRSLAAYDRAARESVNRRLKSLFAAPPAETGDQAKAPAPIFIVGMPRSGTTLLESALGAHPQVDGAGEVSALPFILETFLGWAEETGQGVETVPPSLLSQWRDTYFRNARQFGRRDAPFFTDKQPSNFMVIGMIARLFPAAKIIHIRRAPLDARLSAFRRNFSRQWPFADDQRSIAHFYGQYADLMAHWEAAFAGRFAFVQYERLVADFESELRRLLANCGLPWSDACLNAHETSRPVVTFSAAQVRKPVSMSHLGAAGPYLAQLEPMRRVLVEAGVDLETGRKADFPVH